MKALILDDELYLAQSIANKLSEAGFACEILNDTAQAKLNHRYDVILLSTNLSGFEKIIPHFKQSVIILLVSYISVDTVSEPLSLGASDYIQKPFMVGELLRKIRLHQHLKRLENAEKAYKNFINSYAQRAKLPDFDYKKLKLPVILKANKQINADAFAFGYILERNLGFNYIDAKPTHSANVLLKGLGDLLYISNFQNLAKNEQEIFLAECTKKQLLIHTKAELNSNLQTIELNDSAKELYDGDILTIEEYVKFVITTRQDSLADTDLAKQLGISRKSLWDRRKKYGLSKKR